VATKKSQMSIIITGDKEVDAELKKVEPKLAKKALRKAARKGAKIVQARMKQLAPVRTGKLRKAIKVRAQKRSRTQLGARVISDSIIRDGEKTYYGMAWEYGTKKITARPFIRPAAEASRQEVTDIFRKEVAAQIKEMQKK